MKKLNLVSVKTKLLNAKSDTKSAKSFKKEDKKKASTKGLADKKKKLMSNSGKNKDMAKKGAQTKK